MARPRSYTGFGCPPGHDSARRAHPSGVIRACPVSLPVAVPLPLHGSHRAYGMGADATEEPALSTTNMINFYELLEVSSTASKSEIEQKVKQARRRCQQRLIHPDLNRRQEAERRQQHLTEAKKTLLDDASRAAYDRELASYQPPTSAPQLSGQGDWLERAQSALAANDYVSAAYCAREARQALGESAELWSIQARANSGLGRYDDAVFEARQAVSLEPGNVDYHYDLGTIFEARDEWQNAISCYTQVDRMDPQDPVAKLAIAGIYHQTGELATAVSILEQLYAADGDHMIGDRLAAVLIDTAEAVPAVQTDNGYAITSAAEAEQMQQLSDRARQVVTDPETSSKLDYMQGYIRRCRKRRFRRRDWMSFGGILKRSALWVVLCIFIAVVGPVSADGAIWLILFGFLVLPVIAFFLAREPGWKTNMLVELQRQADLRESQIADPVWR